MANETVSVVFSPVASGGYTFHQTIIYTNKDGESYFATAFPSNVGMLAIRRPLRKDDI